MARIEELDVTQLERLKAVRVRALADAPDAFGATLADTLEQDDAWWEGTFARGSWWVAVDERGDDVGLVAGAFRSDVLGREGEVPWVFSMWVAPQHRGTGLASALLDAVVAWAARRGAEVVGLDVTDRMPRARRFYLRYGFTPTGVTEPLRRDPSITLEEMSLPLPLTR